MKRFMAVVIAGVMVLGFTSSAMASWDKCKGCHVEAGKPFQFGGKPVAAKAELLEKFKTASDFVKAAKASENPLMKAFKDDAALKAAANAIGLK